MTRTRMMEIESKINRAIAENLTDMEVVEIITIIAKNDIEYEFGISYFFGTF